ncbi:GNAT family N-acetyltransferase [Haloimpatiens sp. FM7315]|uniref:GNAT family N-acetyltransferase n=1 Tax=Haloimpatiens sp. FM7315 TaxID=3298609 RepID=UPI0035A3188E
MDKINRVYEKFPILETKRFLLREVKREDLKNIYEIYSNIEVVKYQGMKEMCTLNQAKKSIDFIIKGFKNKKYIKWCIAEKATEKVLGCISLENFRDNNLIAEIGFTLNIKYWKQSIMSEALKEVTKYAFNEIGLKSIEAKIHKDNIASIKLCLKLGFLIKCHKNKSLYNIKTEKYEDMSIYVLMK